MAAWKKLLQQAFMQTPVPTNSSGTCGLWQIYRYIYRALGNAGIENRSPFNLIQVFTIYIKAGSQPEDVRHYCISMLATMDRPAVGYSHAAMLGLVIGLAMTLPLMISPKTANTYRKPPIQESLLIPAIAPLPELDASEIRLALTTDYELGSFSPLEGIIRRHPRYGIYGIDWITRQHDHAYALQLLSASNPDNLKLFCQQHRICEQVAFYRLEVKGKPLYRLLYGNFSNHQAAREGLNALPLTLRKLKPWARQFGQIKKELTPG